MLYRKRYQVTGIILVPRVFLLVWPGSFNSRCHISSSLFSIPKKDQHTITQNTRMTNYTVLQSPIMNTLIRMKIPAALAAATNPTTILGYGSLLSEASARVTFPDLSNFRLVRLRGMRRVFSSPHLFLVSEDLVGTKASLRLASLSCELCDDMSVGLVAAAFDVNLDDEQREAFVKREPEYNITTAPYYDIQGDKDDPIGTGVVCLACENDDDLPSSLDESRNLLPALGNRAVWMWDKDSGLLPADMYLRHCLLAVKKAGEQAEQSFLDETYLVDRKTTLRKYLASDGNEQRIMGSLPPERLQKRFNG